MESIDWNKAPDGATHYNADAAHPWLRKEGSGLYFWVGDWGWQKYSCTNMSSIHISSAIPKPTGENAVKRPQEWDGGGLPPVGAVCEYHLWDEGKKWRKCEVVAHYFVNYFANVVAVDVLDSSAVCLCPSLFRPIKTVEQIAAEERRLAIDEMYSVLTAQGKTMIQRGQLGALYDAGYRKN